MSSSSTSSSVASSSSEDGSEEQLLCFSFNQDYSYLAVGTTLGFSIFTVYPFTRCLRQQCGAVSLVEMLFRTSLVALVGKGDGADESPRTLKLQNTNTNSIICELTFNNTILAVKFNLKRLVVVMEKTIQIYELSNMKRLHQLETEANPLGLCALSPTSENCSYLAYPSSSTYGKVEVYDALNLNAICTVDAHKTPLSAISFNWDGTLLSTASQQGTVVRVFGNKGSSSQSMQKLATFRRGNFPVNIQQMAFNDDAAFLAVSSDSETVHIFEIDHGEGGSGLVGSFFGDMLSDVLEAPRAKYFVKLDQAMKGQKNTVCFSTLSDTLRLVAVSEDGTLIVFNVEDVDEESGTSNEFERYNLFGPFTENGLQDPQEKPKAKSSNNSGGSSSGSSGTEE